MVLLIRRDKLIEEVNKIRTNREIVVLDTRTGITHSIKGINKNNVPAIIEI